MGREGLEGEFSLEWRGKVVLHGNERKRKSELIGCDNRRDISRLGDDFRDPVHDGVRGHVADDDGLAAPQRDAGAPRDDVGGDRVDGVGP